MRKRVRYKTYIINVETFLFINFIITIIAPKLSKNAHKSVFKLCTYFLYEYLAF